MSTNEGGGGEGSGMIVEWSFGGINSAPVDTWARHLLPDPPPTHSDQG